MNKENLTIDNNWSNNIYLLKGFAAVSVPITHWFFSLVIMFIPVTLNVLTLFVLEIGYVGFEIFIFLSGMLLAISVVKTEKNHHSWKKWYKKRIIRLYPSFLLATLINFVFMSFLSFLPYYRYPNFFMKHDVNNLFLSLSGLQSIPIKNNFLSIVPPYWFVTLILSCYILFPIFYFIIKKWFKLMVIISILFYSCFIIFNEPLLQGSEYVVNSLLNHNLSFSVYIRFLPRYFVFFFGMLFGYWIGQNNMSNLIKLQKNFAIKLLILFLLNGIFVLHLYFNSFLGNLGSRGYYTQNTQISRLTRNLTFPLIGILFSVLILITLVNKSNITKKFTLLGKESYEIILIHNISTYTNSYIMNWLSKGRIILLNKNKFNYWYLSIPLILISATLFAYPIYRFSEWVKKKKKLHSFILIISLSLILYGFIAILMFLFHFPPLIDVYSIVMFTIILLSIGIFYKIQSKDNKSIENLWKKQVKI